MRVSIEVDSSTFSHWLGALKSCGQVHSVPIRYLGPHNLTTPPKHLRISGLSLLLHVGKAASPNIGTMSDPSWLFALLRYAQCLALNTRKLELDQWIERLDTHKKGVLSDEFGQGATSAWSEVALKAPYLLDFSTAEQNGWISTSMPRSRRPDFVAVSRLTKSDLFVLEAKGTQTSENHSRRRQIPSGCVQVSSAALVSKNHRVAGRFVVGLALSRSNNKSLQESKILVGDPESEDRYPVEFLKDPTDAVLRTHYFRTAKNFGDTLLADHLLDRADRDESTEDRLGLLRRTLMNGVPAVGSEVTGVSPAGQLRIFVGLVSGIRERLFREQDLSLGEMHSESATAGGEVSERLVTHSDGWCMELEFEERG